MKPNHQDQGIGVITISRPGYNRTPLSSGKTWAEQADLMAAVLDALGINSVIVCGRSGGGPTAVHFAARHPDRCAGLMLFSCNLYPVGTLSKNLPRKLGWNHKLMFWIGTSSVVGWMSWYKAPTDPQGLKWYLDAFLQAISDYNAEERAEEVERLLAGDPIILKCLTDMMPNVIGAMQRPAWEGQMNDGFHQIWDMNLPFDRVKCRTLLAHGKRDNDNSFEHSEYAVQRIEGAQLFALEKGYHICEFDTEWPSVWKEALAMIRASKAAEEATKLNQKS